MYPKDIIIRTPNYIGDTIMMLPALELVRMEYPKARLTIVCKEHSKDLFRNKGIYEIIIDDTKSKNRILKIVNFIKGLRKNSYDLGILFHNSFLTALIFRLSKIKKLIGYNKEKRKFLLDFSLPIDRNWHYSNHYANLVNQYLGNKYSELPKMELYHQPSLLIQKKEKPLVGFVLGGEHKGTRCYPKDSALTLFDSLSSEKLGFVFLGDKQDIENQKLYADVLKNSNAEVIDLTGKTTISEYIDAIATLDLLVTIDTSAMHIAAATSTEFVLLYGKGTSPLSVVFPKSGKGHIMDNGQACTRAEDMIRTILPKDIHKKIIQIVTKKVTFGD